MRALIQRVSGASVTVNGEVVGKVGRGLLVLLGLCKEDGEDTDKKLEFQINKLLKLRVFPDENQKMNLSVTDIQGELLVVSQFTLYGDCKKGTRPSFDQAMAPAEAKALYERYVEQLKSVSGLKVETGIFAAMMDVELLNDGPVTLMIEN